MKVAVIAILHNPISQPYAGGLERFTAELVQGYRAKGLEVDLFASKGSDQNLCNTELFEAFEDNSSIAQAYSYHKIMNIIKDRKYDLIHNNSLHSLPLLYASTQKLPMITTLHTPPYVEQVSAIVTLKGDVYNRFVVPSKFLSRLWEPYLRQKPKVILNGVDLKEWNCAKKNSLKRAVWTGRILPTKGLDLAIKAAHLAEIPISIAGQICNDNYFSETISPLLSADDDYLGHLSQQEMSELYESAAVSISAPRWNEPFGLTTIESIASGTPVAGLSKGAFPELINSESGRLAESETLNGLKIAIKEARFLPYKNVRRQALRFCQKKMLEDYYSYGMNR